MAPAWTASQWVDTRYCSHLHTSHPAQAHKRQKYSALKDSTDGHVDEDWDSQQDTRELVERIEDFPIKGQPIMDTTLKEMLVSLRGTLDMDLMSLVSQIKGEVSELGGRVHHVKSKMGDFATSNNELVDAHNEREEESNLLKAKLADLEDRSHRNKCEIQNCSRICAQAELCHYVQNLIAALLPNVHPSEPQMSYQALASPIIPTKSGYFLMMRSDG